MDEAEVVRLRRAIGRVARQLNSSATDEGLTPTQASVLGLIVGQGAVSPSDLARLEHVNPTMISRVIGKLETDGLISRSPHPDDLRSVTLTATERGRQVQERVRAQRLAVLAARVERLPAGQRAALGRALAALEALGDAQ